MWLNSLEQFAIPENNQENNAAINYAIKANETARAAALSFVKQKLSDPRLIKHINKKLPTFQPKEELVWAAQKINHLQWQVSLTRAIVLLCRGLAYRYTDTIGIQRLDSVTPDGVRYEYTNGSKSEYLSSLRSLDVHKIASKMFEISTHSS